MALAATSESCSSTVRKRLPAGEPSITVGRCHPNTAKQWPYAHVLLERQLAGTTGSGLAITGILGGRNKIPLCHHGAAAGVGPLHRAYEAPLRRREAPQETITQHLKWA